MKANVARSTMLTAAIMPKFYDVMPPCTRMTGQIST